MVPTTCMPVLIPSLLDLTVPLIERPIVAIKLHTTEILHIIWQSGCLRGSTAAAIALAETIVYAVRISSLFLGELSRDQQVLLEEL